MRNDSTDRFVVMERSELQLKIFIVFVDMWSLFQSDLGEGRVGTFILLLANAMLL